MGPDRGPASPRTGLTYRPAADGVTRTEEPALRTMEPFGTLLNDPEPLLRAAMEIELSPCADDDLL